MSIDVAYEDQVTIVTMNRPDRSNAIDREHARALADAFRTFDADDERSVAVLTGAGGTFCAGADLKAIADGAGNRAVRAGDGPMGPTRMLLSKPVIAAVEGHAVAGGLELAIWCDLRVAARDATFGVFCRRWGVPLIDGGNVRLPRLIGHSHALDLILTGRGVGGDEAVSIGLVNRLVEPSTALEHATALAREIAHFPQRCLRNDRLAAYDQWGAPLPAALQIEFEHGLDTLEAPDAMATVQRFVAGEGRHGAPA